MSSSPRRKTLLNKSKNPSLKSDYHSIYVTSTNDSPYHDSPIFPMSPPPLISTKKKSKTQPIRFPNIVNPTSDKSPRKFSPTKNLNGSYKNQTELFSQMEKGNNQEFYNMNYKYRQSQKYKTYQYDNQLAFETSKLRTRQMLNNRYNEEMNMRRSANLQSKKAIEESFKHDLYHEDNIYSTRNKTLRIIPVTDRCDSLLPVKDQHFV